MTRTITSLGSTDVGQAVVLEDGTAVTVEGARRDEVAAVSADRTGFAATAAVAQGDGYHLELELENRSDGETGTILSLAVPDPLTVDLELDEYAHLQAQPVGPDRWLIRFPTGQLTETISLRITLANGATPGTYTIEGGLTPRETDIGNVTEFWPMFQYEPSNTGDGLLNTGPTDDVTTLWEVSMPDPVISSPAVVDSVLYVGSSDEKLYAFDAADGTQLWSYATGRDIHESSPAVADGRVYVANDGQVHAVDADDGTAAWMFAVGANTLTSPTIVDDLVFVGADQYSTGEVVALDGSDGSKRWNASVTGPVQTTPAVAEETVVYGSHNHNVIARDATTGDLAWRISTGDRINTHPAIRDEVVYIGSDDGFVYALDLSDGSEMWRYSVTARGGGPFIAVDGDKVYITEHLIAGSSLIAVDATDGTERWRTTAGFSNYNSNPAIVDGAVYLGTDDQEVYGFDASDGSELWRFLADGHVRSSPAVLDGVLYITSWDDNRIYALTEQ